MKQYLEEILAVVGLAWLAFVFWLFLMVLTGE